MYKHVYQVLTALTLVAWLMVPATQAQSIMLKADIPFDFVVGEKRLPSGEYHVKSLNQATTQIQSKDARSTAIVLTTGMQAAKISDVGKLVFNRYGDQYFLSKIWAASSDSGRELPKSRLEREVAQRLSEGGTTVVAAKSAAKK
jgi:hypothetical protein